MTHETSREASLTRVRNWWSGYRLLTVTDESASLGAELLDFGLIDGFHLSRDAGLSQSTLMEFSRLPKVRGLALQLLPDLQTSDLLREAKSLAYLSLDEVTPWPDFKGGPELLGFSASAKGKDPACLPASLQFLALRNYPHSSLMNISSLSSLSDFGLGPAPRLLSLDGLPASVTQIALGPCPKLTDLRALDRCRLTKIIIDLCKRAEGLSALGEQRDLRYLMLANLGTIPSISFVSKCQKLDFLSFPGTDVEDGDMRSCVGIEYIFFNQKKHYSHTLRQTRAT